MPRVVALAVVELAVIGGGLLYSCIDERLRLIAQVNYFGVVDLLDAWRPALAAADRAKVVAFSSNSTTTTPAVPARTVRAFLAHDAEKAVRSTRVFGKNASAILYAASKIALSRRVRLEAVKDEWAGAGIRLNALAPGAIMTPLLEEQLSTPKRAKVVRSFPVPIGGFGDAGQLADWALFMLSDAADFLCGSVVFVDLTLALRQFIGSVLLQGITSPVRSGQPGRGLLVQRETRMASCASAAARARIRRTEMRGLT